MIGQALQFLYIAAVIGIVSGCGLSIDAHRRCQPN